MDLFDHAGMFEPEPDREAVRKARLERIGATAREVSREEAVRLMEEAFGDYRDEFEAMAVAGLENAAAVRVVYAEVDDDSALWFVPAAGKGLWCWRRGESSGKGFIGAENAALLKAFFEARGLG